MGNFKMLFMYMSPNADYTKDSSQITSQNGDITKTIGVSNLEMACKIAKQVLKEDYNLIELCGAFGEEGAKTIIEATDNKIAVGYVIHLPSQNPLFNKLFGNS